MILPGKHHENLLGTCIMDLRGPEYPNSKNCVYHIPSFSTMDGIYLSSNYMLYYCANMAQESLMSTLHAAIPAVCIVMKHVTNQPTKAKIKERPSQITHYFTTFDNRGDLIILPPDGFKSLIPKVEFWWMSPGHWMK